jgi:TPP-dependent indolepyruvate ferredoxin oxidoreductase alpha subunit
VAIERVLEEEFSKPGVAVMIVRQPCIQLRCAPVREERTRLDSEKCVLCEMCLTLGCPALTLVDDHIVLDEGLCASCGLCIRQCPTFSIDEGSLKQGRTLLTCTKCGRCVDACPKKAISFHVRGTGVGLRPNLARVLFLYPAFLVFTAVGGGMIAFAIWHLLRLIATGSII